VISLAVPLLCVAVGVLCLVAAISAFGTPYNQCDNMAGTCLRERQQAAILGLQLLCVVGVAASVLVAVGWGRWRPRWSYLAAVVLVVGTAAAVFVLLADPINHLNNRWSGWLGV
jgi:peptidoglycan/LPS O-acetylase OafA/YrhL